MEASAVFALRRLTNRSASSFAFFSSAVSDSKTKNKNATKQKTLNENSITKNTIIAFCKAHNSQIATYMKYCCVMQYFMAFEFLASVNNFITIALIFISESANSVDSFIIITAKLI